MPTAKKTPAPKKTAKKLPVPAVVAPAKKKVTEVAIVLDRSGSMVSYIDETISGFNEQIESIRKSGDQGGETRISLYTFNHEVRCVYAAATLDRVQPLNRENYKVSGTTAYYDAMAKAATDLKARASEDEDAAYLIISLSDGDENASKEYSGGYGLKELLKPLQDSGRWTFVYAGAGGDLDKVAAHTGMDTSNIAAYSATRGGTTKAARAMSLGTESYFATRSAGGTAVSNFFGTQGPADLTEDSPYGATNTPIVSDATINQWTTDNVRSLPDGFCGTGIPGGIDPLQDILDAQATTPVPASDYDDPSDTVAVSPPVYTPMPKIQPSQPFLGQVSPPENPRKSDYE